MAYSYAKLTPTATQLGGKLRIITVNVTPDAATGSVVIAECTTIYAVLGTSWNADLTANCYTIQAIVNSTTANQVDFKQWKAGGTAADTAFVGFNVTVIAE